ncbi:MAG: PD-(D/E)XK nuclease family protein [Acidimicrobiia bacterium]|nr:PD-(D/E)XK nuclease family protein [Acidimicrobiia bacterium]
MMTIVSTTLNAAQQQVLDQLGSTDRPTFEPELRAQLRHELDQAFEPMLELLSSEDPLFVSKRTIGMVHSCEQLYIADQTEDFQWSVPIARGMVAHKAIELLVGYRGQPTPLDLVDAAMARLENDFYGPADFLQGLDEGERAELVSLANDRVTTFMETFPPLDRRWRPTTEAKVRAEFGDGRIQLSGKIDLQLGYARGNQAGKVTIDLKTGRTHRSHIDDLRFYALIDTLKTGTPPRLLVSYYLEQGTPHTEQVTEDLLWTAARRTAEAVARIVELNTGDVTPERTPCGSCTFCPLRSSCEPGMAYLAERSQPS